MSNNIGQYRRASNYSYVTPISVTLDYVLVNSPASEDIKFKDVSGTVSIDTDHYYYVRFGVQRLALSDQTFRLKLMSSTDSQLIDTYTVAQGNTSEVVYFEAVIAPNATYTEIRWELARTAEDMEDPHEGYYGRTMTVTVDSFGSIADIMAVLKNQYPNLEYFKQIGIQGPTGLLMCINGEQIRVGRSGIYELGDGVPIVSIGFIPKTVNGQLEYFLMDFVY